jgi:hypothetical protein
VEMVSRESREMGRAEVGGLNELGEMFVGDKINSLKRIIGQYVERGSLGRKSRNGGSSGKGEGGRGVTVSEKKLRIDD